MHGCDSSDGRQKYSRRLTDSRHLKVTCWLIAALLAFLVSSSSWWSPIVYVSGTVFDIAVLEGQVYASTNDMAESRIPFNLSFEWANQHILGPMGHSMRAVYTPDNNDPSMSMFRTTDAVSYCGGNQPVWGILGPRLSRSALPASRVARASNTPLISYSATSPELSDKSSYPTFNRVVPPDDKQVAALATLCKYYGWSRVAVISTNDAYGNKMATSFADATSALGIDLLFTSFFDATPGSVTPTPTPTQAADIHAGLKLMLLDDVRIIAVFAIWWDSQFVLDEAARLGMNTSDYVWLGSDGNLPTYTFPVGSIATNLYANVSSPVYLDLESRIHAVLPNMVVNQFQAKEYDAGLLMAYGIAAMEHIRTACGGNPSLVLPTTYNAPVDACTSVTGTNTQQRGLLNQMLRRVSFEGAGGYVRLDANGDNPCPYSIVNQFAPGDRGPQSSVNIAIREIGVIQIDGSVVSFQPAIWPGYATVPPLDHRGVRLGATVTNHPEIALYVLAFAVATVGAWVALILLEQAMALRVQHTTRAVTGWLVLASLAAAVGVWSSSIIAVTAIRLPDLPDANALITFDAVQSFSAVLVAWPLMCISFLIVIRGVHSRAAARLTLNTDKMFTGSDAGSTTQNTPEITHAVPGSNGTVVPSTVVKNAFAVTPKKKSKQMNATIRAIADIWLFPGAIFMTCSVFGTNMLVFFGIRVTCDPVVTIGIIIAAVAWCLVWSYAGLFLLFHLRVTQYRFLGAFVMGAAIFGFHAIARSAIDNVFNGTIPHHDLEGSTLQLVGAVVTAVISFILIGLNVTRLKLSRDVLDAYLIQTQKKVRRLERRINSMSVQIDENSMLFTLISIVMRPITRRAHFILTTMLGTAEAHDALYGFPKPTGMFGAPISPPPPQRGLMSSPPPPTTSTGAVPTSPMMSSSSPSPLLPTAALAPSSSSASSFMATIATPTATSASVAAATAMNNTNTKAGMPSRLASRVSADLPPSSLPPPAFNNLPSPNGGLRSRVTPSVTPKPPTSPLGLGRSLTAGALSPAPTIGMGSNNSGHGDSPTATPKAIAAMNHSSTFGGIGAGTGHARASTLHVNSSFAGDTGTRTPIPRSPMGLAMNTSMNIGTAANGGMSPMGKQSDATTPTHVTGRSIAIHPVNNEAKDVTMMNILQNHACLEVYKDAVASYHRHSSDNLCFWIDCQQYKLIDSGHERRQACMDMIKVYLADNAPNQLGMVNSLRLSTLRKCHESDIPSRKVFDSAESEVVRLLALHDWPRFIGSEEYHTCVAILRATRHFRARQVAAIHYHESTNGGGAAGEHEDIQQYVSRRISSGHTPYHGDTSKAGGPSTALGLGGRGGGGAESKLGGGPVSRVMHPSNIIIVGARMNQPVSSALDNGELNEVLSYLDVDPSPLAAHGSGASASSTLVDPLVSAPYSISSPTMLSSHLSTHQSSVAMASAPSTTVATATTMTGVSSGLGFAATLSSSSSPLVVSSPATTLPPSSHSLPLTSMMIMTSSSTATGGNGHSSHSGGSSHDSSSSPASGYQRTATLSTRPVRT